MRRLVASLLVSLLAVSVASAATLSVTSDKLTYVIGETITLTVIGDPQGATSYGVFGELRYNGALVNSGTRTQPTLIGPLGPWIKAPLNTRDTNLDDGGSFSDAFSQIAADAQTATNIPGTTLSTVTLIATAIGLLEVNWHTAFDGSQLDFFGLTSAPGISVCITAEGFPSCAVPEPSTGLLVIAGLIGFGAHRRICA